MTHSINIKGTFDQEDCIELCDVMDYTERNCRGVFKKFIEYDIDDFDMPCTEITVHIKIHPCDSWLHFHQNYEKNESQITCTAETVYVGPGYHAYVVDMLEMMGEELKITWRWNAQEGEKHYGDSTGYYHHRNYERLQFAMLEWLQSICRQHAGDPDNSRIMISFADAFPKMKCEYFAASPVGFWTRRWFEEVATTKLNELQWAGRDFFVWWNAKRDALFYKQTGIAVMNVFCNWLHPGDGGDKKVLSIINRCLREAARRQPLIELPEHDWNTVQALARGKTAILDYESGYGFRKFEVLFDLPEGWQMYLPGATIFTDKQSLLYFDEEREIEVKTFTDPHKQGDDATMVEFYFEWNEQISSDAEYIYSSNNLTGKAVIYYEVDTEDGDYWVLHGVYVKDQNYLIITVIYSTLEQREWAEEIWNSVKRSEGN